MRRYETICLVQGDKHTKDKVEFSLIYLLLLHPYYLHSDTSYKANRSVSVILYSHSIVLFLLFSTAFDLAADAAECRTCNPCDSSFTFFFRMTKHGIGSVI